MSENNVLSNYVKFLRGTPTAYAALTEKDKDTLYFITTPGSDVGKIYLGEVLVAGNVTADGDSVMDSLAELTDVNLQGLKNGQVLGYDGEKWIPMDRPEAVEISTMVGASETGAGEAGLVPAPQAGDQNKFLKGDGTWSAIEIPEVAETQIFEATLNVVDGVKETHDAAIVRVVGEATPVKGDIVIVKDPIAEGKLQHTAYVYNGSAWAAMDGNYNAKNVFFDQDFTFTKAIGTVTIPSTGSTVVDAEGKSVYDFFAGLFAAEDTSPDISTQPSVSSAVLNKAGAYEAGTELTNITYAATFEDGKYQYGPEPTGVTVSAWEAKTNAGAVVGNAASGSLADMVVADDTNYYLTIKATYGNGSYAKTNLGNESTVRITASSKTKNTSAITGYRNSFYGTLDSADTVLTSDVIRGLTKTGATLVTGSTFTVDIPASAKKAIIAVPKGLEISSVKHEEGLGAPVLSTFTPQDVTVEGADGNAAIVYDVYVASVGYSSTNHYNVTI
jgi:hypothetical protein